MNDRILSLLSYCISKDFRLQSIFYDDAKDAFGVTMVSQDFDACLTVYFDQPKAVTYVPIKLLTHDS